MSDKKILNAEEYVFKNMMTDDTFKVFMRVRSVIYSCKDHYQLCYAIKYNSLARKSTGFDWCLDGFIDKKSKDLSNNNLHKP